MYSVTLSAKYQVVIPKVLRRELNLQRGQRVHVRQNRYGEIVVSTKPAIGAYYGIAAGRHVWGDDPVQNIRTERDKWDA